MEKPVIRDGKRRQLPAQLRKKLGLLIIWKRPPCNPQRRNINLKATLPGDFCGDCFGRKESFPENLKQITRSGEISKNCASKFNFDDTIRRTEDNDRARASEVSKTKEVTL